MRGKIKTEEGREPGIQSPRHGCCGSVFLLIPRCRKIDLSFRGAPQGANPESRVVAA
jgi:hypothetical protein